MLSRIERSAATNNPNDFYYFLDGAQVGELTNNGNHDPTRDTYSGTFVTRNWNFITNTAPQPFRWNTSGGITAGQFGGSGYDPISPSSQGMKGTDSRYTVRDGDTLQGIAASVWGDASLWYMLAEANGLSGSEALPAGSSLIIPDKVVNIHNSSKTFEVYDPNRAIGDLSPTSAKPPKKANKCGMIGTILLVAVAVAVTALTYGALTGPTTGLLGTVLAGAASGAAGSVVSQGFGVATGLQDKFSWKAVGMAALSGAVGGGIGSVAKGAMLGSKFVGDVVRGAAGSALTQGIGVAIGLQKKFDFAAVAAAGVGAGVLGAVSRNLASKGLGVAPENITADTVRNAGFYANQALSGAAGAIANAATRSLANGSDFGDNVLAALPDVIGSTIGNLIADPITAKMMRTKQEERIEKLATSDILPEEIRGTAPVTEMVREAINNGASNKDVRRMLADAGAQAYFAELTSQQRGEAFAVSNPAEPSLANDQTGSQLPTPALTYEGNEPSLASPLSLVNDGVYRTVDGMPVDQFGLPIDLGVIGAAGPRGYRTRFSIDILQEDRYGGHTYAFHIGKDDAFLRRRLSTPIPGLSSSAGRVYLTETSTFLSLNSANRLVNAALSLKAYEVDSFLRGNERQRAITAYFTTPTGRTMFSTAPVVSRNRNPGSFRSETTYGVTVVLRRAPYLPNGFYVLTSYPSGLYPINSYNQ